MDAGVWPVDSDTVAAILDQGQPDRRLIVLDTAGAVDREGFFAAVRAQLPQDPPLGTYRDVWDALADSLFGGLDEMDASVITVVWTGSDRFRRAAPGDYAMALEVLRDVTSQLADPEATASRPTLVRVLVG